MYSYTIGGKKGKKITLQESKNRVVVRTKNARKLDNAIFTNEAKEALQGFSVEMEFPEADITILKTKEEKAAEPAIRDKARSALKKEPELRFAGRVLMDKKSNEPVLYTENIFVKFHDKVSADDCEKILAKNKLVIKQKLDFAKNSYFVQAPENTGLKVFEIAEALLKKKEVELCHPELIRRKSYKGIHPNQWHLKATSINGKNINAHVKADAAHQLSKGESIVIAVIDDGVDIDNPEFNIPGKVVHARNIGTNSNNPRPIENEDTHGTPCAGVATAAGITASGVAPKAVLMPIRMSHHLGAMGEALAFKWAVDHGADIISCSWGPADGKWWDPHDPQHTSMEFLPDSTRLAINDAVTRGRNGKGCVIFFAAGNGNEDVKYDGYASYEKVIAVAASNDTNKRSVYSDFGSAVWCCFPSDDSEFPEINHPAPLTKGIFTTDRRGNEGDAPGDYTETFGGTSSACPGAAGTAALILSANPDLTWQQVRDILKETSEKIDTASGQYNAQGHSKKYGYGKIDAEKAVKKAIAMKATNGVTTAKVKIVSALVDPAGADTGKEKIALKNTTATNTDLSGWSIEVKGKKQTLNVVLNSGQSKTISLNGPVKLANTGGTIKLLDKQQQVVDTATYKKQQVKKGVTIQFG
ncbi:MAG: S8 family serine peptidase [Chitinophagaceae bacterium]|nr:S8 family serine peptidase [Chitinophagaceae bacterium]